MSDLVSVFSSIILLATVSTLSIAVFAYVAYKVRERRKPDPSAAEASSKGEVFRPVFLRRHMLDDIDTAAAGDASLSAAAEPITQGRVEK